MISLVAGIRTSHTAAHNSDYVHNSHSTIHHTTNDEVPDTEIEGKKRRRRRRRTPSREAFSKAIEAVRITQNKEDFEMSLKNLESLTNLCNLGMDDGDLDNDFVTDQLVELVGFADIDEEEEMSSSNSSDISTTGAKKRKRRYVSSLSSEKQQIKYLKSLVLRLKEHQIQEAKKLVKVKKGVEHLVTLLDGANAKLYYVKKANSDQSEEITRLQEQQMAANNLAREISDIQEHARINYETGHVELALATGEMEQLTLDELAAKVQSVRGGETMKSNHETDEILSGLADPAVLHADLRLLIDIVLLLGSATIGGVTVSMVSMPPLIGYVASGIVIGPSGFDLIHTVVEVDTLAQFGSVFFLFAHGLENNVSGEREFLSVAAGGCLLATIVCALCIQMYVLMAGIAQSNIEGGLLGLSSSLASLSLVLDYLHEQKLLSSEHGKVMVSILTFQGLMMGFLFSIPPAISDGVITYYGVGFAMMRSFIAILAVIACAGAFARWAMPPMMNFLLNKDTGSNELYLLGVVSITMVMALITEHLGLSLDLGSFFAGLMFSSSPRKKKTMTLIQPLASVFASMLFASIGMIINPTFFWMNMVEILIVVAQIVIIKMVVITTVVRIFNFSWETSIKCGMGMAHVGEFSLLFSSKLQAHLLLSRRAYLILLAATATTLAIAPVALRFVNVMAPALLHFLGLEDDTKRRHRKLGFKNVPAPRTKHEDSDNV